MIIEDEDLSKLDRGDTPVADQLEDEQIASLRANEKDAGDKDAGDKDAGDKEVGDKDDDLETEEERAEREAAEAAELEAAEKAKRIRIPKARFDEAMAKARQREEALNAKIAELQQAQNKGQDRVALSDLQKKIDEQQDKYEDLILDGDREAARAVRRQIDSMREQLIDMRTSEKTDAARRAAVEDLKYDAALASLEAQHPALNPDSESYDVSVVEEVAVLLDAFAARGFARPTALAKAVKYVLGDPPNAAAGKETAAAVRATRATDARRKASDANSKQPPSTTGVGLNSDRAGATADDKGVDIMRMSQDSFAKLDEATKARLRGDEV